MWDGWTDGYGHNVMPPMPSGGGIKYDNHDTVKSVENSLKQRGNLCPKHIYI
jgi:hypothetical protein